MRRLLTIGLFALAVPVFASDPVNPDPAFEPLTSWEGKHSDQLIAEWGKPRKTKRHGKNGKVLVYRLRFFGDELVGETEDNESGTRYPGQPEVIATQKVKFYVDRQGIIQREEYAPRKWKQKKP